MSNGVLRSSCAALLRGLPLASFLVAITGVVLDVPVLFLALGVGAAAPAVGDPNSGSLAELVGGGET